MSNCATATVGRELLPARPRTCVRGSAAGTPFSRVKRSFCVTRHLSSNRDRQERLDNRRRFHPSARAWAVAAR